MLVVVNYNAVMYACNYKCHAFDFKQSASKQTAYSNTAKQSFPRFSIAKSSAVIESCKYTTQILILPLCTRFLILSLDS